MGAPVCVCYIEKVGTMILRYYLLFDRKGGSKKVYQRAFRSRVQNPESFLA